MNSLTPRVNATRISILKQPYKKSLSGLLKTQKSVRLKLEVRLEVQGNTAHKTLEGKLLNEELCAPLVPADLAHGHSARTVAVRLPDGASGRGKLTSCLDGQLPAVGRLASSAPLRVLLSPGHDRNTSSNSKGNNKAISNRRDRPNHATTTAPHSPTSLKAPGSVSFAGTDVL